jgi:predicted nuclease with TOPRIM domain
MAADSVVETSVDRGTLDIWPAHSGSHQNKLSNVSKPLFLKQMEDHLQKELAILGCPKAGPHISRLQAHKEVFEHLIENFKTYKPLLSAIKNEYDLFIKYQDGCIRELLPLKTQINLMEDEFEKRVLSIKERNKKYDEGIHEQCRTLQQQITELKSKEKSYEAQLKRLQEELAIVYEKYRNEADGRKLLISDYNELKARLSKGHEEEEICDKEDPTILKLKLARATEDLRASNGRINQILADYGDVVPRRDFEMMETSYRGVESELETLKVKYTSLQDEHNVLTGMYKDMAEHRDKVLNELTRMKGTATPRPDWSRCAEFIEGGEEVWAELSEGKSSDHLVDVLLAQIAGVDVSELMRQEVFTGQVREKKGRERMMTC